MNAGLCNGLRDAVAQWGVLVPEQHAHCFAGVGRARWSEIKKRQAVPVITLDGMKFVPLNWIETRRTRPGRLGLLHKIIMGQIHGIETDTPLASRQKSGNV